MKVKFFDPGREFKLHEKEYLKEWLRVRRKGDLILRGDLEEFEKNFANYLGVKYVVGCNSGTDALFIILKAMGIGEGDFVAVPSHTFVATVQVVAQVGANPVLYDLDRFLPKESLKAVIVAHIAGEINVSDIAIIDWAIEEGVPVIEDSCQALGAEHQGRKAGTIGNAGAFSFYPAKILGCPGDGGAIVTNEKEIHDFAIEYRNHWKKDYSKWGINSRLDNVLAAELNIKLKRLPKVLKRRQEIAKMYYEGIKNPSIKLPNRTEGRVYQDFIVETKFRDNLYTFLKENDIETMKNEYFFPIKKGKLAVEFEKRSLRLPINEVLTDKEINYVIKMVNSF